MRFFITDGSIGSFAISSIFTYLYKNKKLNDNPMDRVEPISYAKKVKQTLTDEQFIDIFKNEFVEELTLLKLSN